MHANNQYALSNLTSPRGPKVVQVSSFPLYEGKRWAWQEKSNRLILKFKLTESLVSRRCPPRTRILFILWSIRYENGGLVLDCLKHTNAYGKVNVWDLYDTNGSKSVYWGFIK